MRLQYTHIRSLISVRDNKTVAVYQPNRFELEALEAQLDKDVKPLLKIKIGVAKLHPDDKEWVKKTGRDIALQNMRFEEFELDYIHKELGTTFYGFVKGHEHFTFKLSKDYVSAFLVSMTNTYL